MATIIGSGLESYLHQQAREHALNRIAEAKDEAAQIIAQATREVAALQQTSEERTARIIEERRRRALAQARLKAKQAIIRHHEAWLDRVWSQAAATLQAPLETSRRLSMLARLIEDAAGQLGGGALALRVSAEDRQMLTPDVLSELCSTLKSTYQVDSIELSEESANIWGGAIVERRDARQLVNNTLNERLALAQRVLRDHVYRLLTGV